MKERKNNAGVDALQARFDRLKQRLLRLNPVLLGTITQRRISRDDPERPGKQKTYGPYYQWTFKQEGKTVTVNLSENQAAPYQKAIEENRLLEQILSELRALSLKILEDSTEGVKKRNQSK